MPVPPVALSRTLMVPSLTTESSLLTVMAAPPVRTVTPAPALTRISPAVEVVSGVVELVVTVVWASAAAAARHRGAAATAAIRRFIEIPETKSELSPMRITAG